MGKSGDEPTERAGGYADGRPRHELGHELKQELRQEPRNTNAIPSVAASEASMTVNTFPWFPIGFLCFLMRSALPLAVTTYSTTSYSDIRTTRVPAARRMINEGDESQEYVGRGLFFRGGGGGGGGEEVMEREK